METIIIVIVSLGIAYVVCKWVIRKMILYFLNKEQKLALEELRSVIKKCSKGLITLEHHDDIAHMPILIHSRLPLMKEFREGEKRCMDIGISKKKLSFLLSKYSNIEIDVSMLEIYKNTV